MILIGNIPVIRCGGSGNIKPGSIIRMKQYWVPASFLLPPKHLTPDGIMFPCGSRAMRNASEDSGNPAMVQTCEITVI